MVAWNELFRGNGRHTLKLGMRGDNDEVLYSERCRKKAEFLGVVKHTFSYDCGKGERITAVIAYDEWSDDTGGDPEVLSGGVGRDHVTIKVTSERNRGFHFLFEVYGTKAKERPTKSNTSGSFSVQRVINIISIVRMLIPKC